jgi:hypothetical protein
MVTATVHCTPRKAWRASTTGCKRHVVTCRAAFLVQTPEALGVLRDGPDLFLQDDLLRRGGQTTSASHRRWAGPQLARPA